MGVPGACSETPRLEIQQKTWTDRLHDVTLDQTWTLDARELIWLAYYIFVFFSLVLSRVDPLHPLWHFGKDLCKDLPHQFEECPVMVSCGHVGGDHCGSVVRCPGQHVGVSIQTAAAVVEVLDVLSQAAVRGGEGTTDSGDGAATSRWKPMTMQHIDWSLVLTLDLKGIHVHVCMLYL